MFNKYCEWEKRKSLTCTCKSILCCCSGDALVTSQARHVRHCCCLCLVDQLVTSLLLLSLFRRPACDVTIVPFLCSGDHQHSKHVWFSKLGLGGKNEVNRKSWRLETFGTILKRFHHENVSQVIFQRSNAVKYQNCLCLELSMKIFVLFCVFTLYNASSYLEITSTSTFALVLVRARTRTRTCTCTLRHNLQKTIDILKIDIEGDEWSALATMFAENSLRNVKQLLFEVHLQTTVNLNQFKLMQTLEKLGFRKLAVHINQTAHFITKSGRRLSKCYELSYVNINFLL